MYKLIILLIVAFPLILVTCENVPPTDNIDLENGLVAYFPFNGNANDESGNGNDGIVIDATLTQDRFENADSAYSFDGDGDYIDFPAAVGDELSPTDAVSISAWIKTDTVIQLKHVVDRLETADGYGLAINDTGHARFSINGGTARGTSAIIVDDNQWHHIAGSYDKNAGGINEIIIYVDGVQSGTEDYSDPIDYTPEPRSEIGIRKDTLEYDFNGIIDDVRIYNRALNAAEIEALFQHENN
jgi:hypothetical protein